MKKDRPERFGDSPPCRKRRVNALRKAVAMLEPLDESAFDENGLRQDIDCLTQDGIIRANPLWSACWADPVCYRVRTEVIHPENIRVRWEPDDE